MRALNDAGQRVGSWLPVIPPTLGPSLTGGDNRDGKRRDSDMLTPMPTADFSGAFVSGWGRYLKTPEQAKRTPQHFDRRDHARLAKRLVRSPGRTRP